MYPICIPRGLHPEVYCVYWSQAGGESPERATKGDRVKIEMHGVELTSTWFDRRTVSAQLGFCTDPGVSELAAKFKADGAHVPTVDGYVVAFVKVPA